MKDTPSTSRDTSLDNVIDLFSGKPLAEAQDSRFIRLAPEMDGLEMLYSNTAHPGQLFSLEILCWGLRANGEVVGLVPWLEDIVPATDIHDPLNGHWEGYYDPGIDEVFETAPIHKVVELETAAEYYEYDCNNPEDVLQEIPDTIGTHAILAEKGFRSITLTEVVSWRLHYDGSIAAMIIDEKKVESTPVLPGDACLYPAKDNKRFRYFFQHGIANKIKAKDPEALEAIALLVD